MAHSGAGPDLERGQEHVPMALTAAFTVAAIAGTFVGSRLAGHIPAPNLHRLFAGFVMLVALFLLTANYRKARSSLKRSP